MAVLLGFGLLVLAVLICDARRYQGVDLRGQPIYMEDPFYEAAVLESMSHLNDCDAGATRGEANPEGTL